MALPIGYIKAENLPIQSTKDTSSYYLGVQVGSPSTLVRFTPDTASAPVETKGGVQKLLLDPNNRLGNSLQIAESRFDMGIFNFGLDNGSSAAIVLPSDTQTLMIDFALTTNVFSEYNSKFSLFLPVGSSTFRPVGTQNSVLYIGTNREDYSMDKSTTPSNKFAISYNLGRVSFHNNLSTGFVNLIGSVTYGFRAEFSSGGS